ncbi:hypothetical protein NW759_013051 [Fusarium solani]|nr:hypothetical protein NW759_013051 [Fusarium solani]
MKFLAILAIVAACNAGPAVFNLPKSPPGRSALLDHVPVGFSFDYGFAEYLQNVSLTLKCMRNLKSVSGVWPDVRLGAGEDDWGEYKPDLDEYLYYYEIEPGSFDRRFYYGKRYLKAVAKYPGLSVFVPGLNRGSDNLTNTILAAKDIARYIPSVKAVELGNEPDSKIYPYTGPGGKPHAVVTNAGFDNTTWTPEAEASSESKWNLAVGRGVGKPFIQAGGYYLPTSLGWSAKSLLTYLKPAAKNYVKFFSHHNYPQTVSDRATSGLPRPDLKSLMSHVNVSSNVGQYQADAAFSTSQGIQYVLGETNSVSGGGDPEISPTFGAGLWVLDYSLRAASTNISRLNFHFQGINSVSYYVWWDLVGVKAPYYGALLATEAMAGGDRIAALDNGTTNYAAYAIYSKGTPKSMVLINTDIYTGDGERQTKEFAISGLTKNSLFAKRLTAQSALARQEHGDLPTFGGQFISDTTCKLEGLARKEEVKVRSGTASFVLSASEALLVQL